MESKQKTILQLERDEHLLRLCIEHSPASIAMYDLEMRTIAASRRYLEDYRLEGDIIGRKHYEVFPDIPERWKEIHKRCLAGAVEKSEMDCFPRADGTIDWVRWEIYPWYETPGVIGGIMLFSEVITDRKNADDELKRTLQSMKELNATKDKLFSILAHDLRGPFTGLVGLTKELAINAARFTPEEVSEAATIMHASAEKLHGLLNNLLEWSRLQTGKLELKPVQLNLHKEVSVIIDLFSSAIANKSLRVHNLIGIDTFIYVDPYSVNTVLRNFISNAIKFTPAFGTIWVSSIHQDSCTVIIVEDSGVGMSQDVIEKIFKIDSGYSTNGTNGEEGSGLGLALCKELIEKNKGNIEVISTPGKGTIFSFSLQDQK